MSKATTPTDDLEFDETREEALQGLVDEYPEGSTIHDLASRYLAKYQDGGGE